MRNKYIYISIVLLFLLPSRMSAGIDPTRAAAFATISAAASKVIVAQDAVITSQLGAHIIMNKEIKKVTNFKKKFNDYLSTYNDILALAAQLYGVYYEIDLAITNVRNLKTVVLKVPENVLAVSIIDKKNSIYNNILETGIKVAGDIESVLPYHKDTEKNPKMTQKERIMAIGKIRAYLRRMNLLMYNLCRSIKYTTLMDAWYYYSKHHPAGASTRPMADIVSECQKRWIDNARGANKYNTRK